MVTVKIDKATWVAGEWSAYLSFSYDQNMIDFIRELPSRRWDKEQKKWEIPLEQLKLFINRFSDQEYDISGVYVNMGKQPEIESSEFNFKTVPFHHQIKGFEYGMSHNKWLLGDEQGLGKTKQVIDIAVAKKLQYGYKHCLIVCGVNGLKWNWVNEVITHSNEKAYILGQRLHGNKVVIEGNAEKLADLNDFDNIKEYFVITNIETLRSEEIVEKLAQLCRSQAIEMIAFDEFHKTKNPSSQQAKGILKLQASNMIAMTGTPLMNSPLDLYVVLRWLGYEKHAFYAFKNHYCVMGGYGGYEVISYKNLDHLADSLKGIMLRRLKKDVLDLPEKIYISEYVEMTAKQEQIYKEVTADIKANIDKIKMSSNPLAELIRMRQATGYTGILSDSIKESAKLDRMEELVEEAVENGKKVVIFSNWTQMTDVIKARLSKKYKGVVITGQTADVERQVNVNHFQNNPECKYAIGTIGAMGTGITLTAGTVEIFMDEPWNKALKDQAEDRCHRVGTTESITIYTLLCKNTIDERIHALIDKKGKMSDMLVDGQIAMNKKELIDYLID